MKKEDWCRCSQGLLHGSIMLHWYENDGQWKRTAERNMVLWNSQGRKLCSVGGVQNKDIM